jgi:hypothetical protein
MMDEKTTQKVIGAVVVTALFFGGVGYYLGIQKGSSWVPQIVGTSNAPQAMGEPDYSTKVSEVKLHPSSKLELAKVSHLTKLVRFKSTEGRVYSVEKTKGSWTEDLDLGVADAVVSGNAIYLCSGKTPDNREYTYYSNDEKCWAGTAGKKQKFSLANQVSPVHLPLFACRTSDGAFYLTLNNNCEDKTDHPQTLLGYVRASHIVQMQ